MLCRTHRACTHDTVACATTPAKTQTEFWAQVLSADEVAAKVFKFSFSHPGMSPEAGFRADLLMWLRS